MIAAESIHKLRSRLVGRAFSSITLGDWWALSFYDGLWLQAHHLTSSNAHALTARLTGYADAIDAADVPVAIDVLRCRRRDVRRVELRRDGGLELHFENRTMLVCETDTEIVDWQWCINVSGVDPYVEYEVACFFAGEVVCRSAAA